MRDTAPAAGERVPEGEETDNQVSDGAGAKQVQHLHSQVDDQERWQSATIGFSFVGNDAAFVNDVLYRVLSFIEGTGHDAEVLDYQTELLEVF